MTGTGTTLMTGTGMPGCALKVGTPLETNCWLLNDGESNCDGKILPLIEDVPTGSRIIICIWIHMYNACARYRLNVIDRCPPYLSSVLRYRSSVLAISTASVVGKSVGIINWSAIDLPSAPKCDREFMKVYAKILPSMPVCRSSVIAMSSVLVIGTDHRSSVPVIGAGYRYRSSVIGSR